MPWLHVEQLQPVALERWKQRHHHKFPMNEYINKQLSEFAKQSNDVVAAKSGGLGTRLHGNRKSRKLRSSSLRIISATLRQLSSSIRSQNASSFSIFAMSLIQDYQGTIKTR